MGTEKKEIEIDFKQLVMELLHHVWVIVLSTGIIAVAALTISMFFITPMYRSTTKVYILNKQSDVGVTVSDVQLATQLTTDYEQLIKSRNVLETVIADMDLELELASLASVITVSSPTGTRFLEISVTDDDPYFAQQVADKVRDVASRQIVEIMNIDAVNTVDKANLPTAPASPDVKRNALLGAVVGFVFACAIIILKFILNDTIRNAEDIENYLGLSVLGMIPDSNEVSKKPGYGQKKEVANRKRTTKK